VADCLGADQRHQGNHLVDVITWHAQRLRGGEMLVDVARAVDGKRGAHGDQFGQRVRRPAAAGVHGRREAEGVAAHPLGSTGPHADGARHGLFDVGVGRTRAPGLGEMIGGAGPAARRHRNRHRHQFLIQYRQGHRRFLPFGGAADPRLISIGRKRTEERYGA
jgi:hypothetical protein